jgi:hypothetical protein
VQSESDDQLRGRRACDALDMRYPHHAHGSIYLIDKSASEYYHAPPSRLSHPPQQRPIDSNSLLLTCLPKCRPVEHRPRQPLVTSRSTWTTDLQLGLTTVSHRRNLDQGRTGNKTTRKYRQWEWDENVYAVSPNTGLMPPASLPVRNRCPLLGHTWPLGPLQYRSSARMGRERRSSGKRRAGVRTSCRLLLH